MPNTKKSKVLITIVALIIIIGAIVSFLLLKDSSTKKWCWSQSKSLKTGEINQCRYYDCQKEHLIFKFIAKKPTNYPTSCSDSESSKLLNEFLLKELQKSK